MGELKRLSVTVTSDHMDAIRAALDAGEYGAESEIIREALQGWLADRKARLLEIERIRALIDEADASGPPFPSMVTAFWKRPGSRWLNRKRTIDLAAVFIRTPAENDLRAIWRFIAEDNRRATDALYARLRGKIEG